MSCQLRVPGDPTGKTARAVQLAGIVGVRLPEVVPAAIEIWPSDTGGVSMETLAPCWPPVMVTEPAFTVTSWGPAKVTCWGAPKVTCWALGKTVSTGAPAAVCMVIGPAVETCSEMGSVSVIHSRSPASQSCQALTAPRSPSRHCPAPSWTFGVRPPGAWDHQAEAPAPAAVA